MSRIAGNSLFEWVMVAVQMGFSSHDVLLDQDSVDHRKTAVNWRDTARAIARGEPMRTLSFVGYHYGLLRQCLETAPDPRSRDKAFTP